MEFTDVATEQTTAATDIVLAGVALVCAVALRRYRLADGWKVNLWGVSFTLLAGAALLGAVAHGVKLVPTTHRLVWQVINLCLGLSVALFAVGAADDLAGRHRARQLLPILVTVGLVFFAITCIVAGTFLVFLLYAAVALIVALGIYTYLAGWKHLPGAAWIAVGVLLSLLAALVQALRWGHFVLVWEFDHNGTFHLIQTVGVLALFLGLRASLAGRG